MYRDSINENNRFPRDARDLAVPNQRHSRGLITSIEISDKIC